MNILKQTLQKLKKANYLAIAQILLVFCLAFLPLVTATNAHAAGTIFGTTNCTDLNGVRCTDTSITGLIKTVINWALALSGIVAILFLIIGGFQYITSAGNEEAAEKGKATAINAVIGIIVIILAYVIVNLVANLLTNPTSTATP